MNACVVLPAYNEEGNVTPLIEQLMAVAEDSGLDLSVVAVNDGSRDGTLEELRRLSAVHGKLHVVDHGVNRGFACALRTGTAEALHRGFDVVVFMDCDQSHNPRDLPRFIAALENGHDFILGSRYVVGGGMIGVPVWRVVISHIGNFVGKKVLGLPVKDLTTGYRALRREVLGSLDLREDDFTIQLETVVKAYAAGYSLGEVPTIVKGRRIGTSSMRYNYQFFMNYFRLLRACRKWIREAQPYKGEHAA